MDTKGKIQSFLIVVILIVALLYANAAGIFIIAQFGLPVTSEFLTFLIGYAYIALIIKLFAEIIIGIFSFIGLFL